jgi:hypothetical protein
MHNLSGYRMRRAPTLIVTFLLFAAIGEADEIDRWRTRDGGLYFGISPPPGSVRIQSAATSTPTRTSTPRPPPTRTPAMPPTATRSPAPTDTPPEARSQAVQSVIGRSTNR